MSVTAMCSQLSIVCSAWYLVKKHWMWAVLWNELQNELRLRVEIETSDHASFCAKIFVFVTHPSLFQTSMLLSIFNFKAFFKPLKRTLTVVYKHFSHVWYRLKCVFGKLSRCFLGENSLICEKIKLSSETGIIIRSKERKIKVLR